MIIAGRSGCDEVRTMRMASSLASCAGVGNAASLAPDGFLLDLHGFNHLYVHLSVRCRGQWLSAHSEQPYDGSRRNKLLSAIGLFHRRRRAIPAASIKGKPFSANGIAALPHQEPLAA
ncbi:hypothetical protein EOI86_01775 [Hwanghaeella grinnelliae]|uniref:Uncharacterized protein n=1 Tax=Hwanghaeella grinnelliae TaxID=2500179 RepID=A0A3S2VNT1_9PROT|nr:hypothetical protein [Hwanghaeella grinnelliae]RVU38058.1 hypothetical protein EOI86_01775 [Hwanghaeella grinnelliae]